MNIDNPADGLPEADTEPTTGSPYDWSRGEHVHPQPKRAGPGPLLTGIAACLLSLGAGIVIGANTVEDSHWIPCDYAHEVYAGPDEGCVDRGPGL